MYGIIIIYIANPSHLQVKLISFGIYVIVVYAATDKSSIANFFLF